LNAIVVKYNNNGNVIWKKNLTTESWFNSVTTVADGFIAAGGKSGVIVQKYNNSGDAVWDKTICGNEFKSVTASSDGIVAVGYAGNGCFNNGDWAGIQGKGGHDAIMVKYAIAKIPVTNISNVPTTATEGIPLLLTGKVEPSYATNQTIVWSITDTGTTASSITGNIFNAAGAGAAVITATITDGIGTGEDYTQDFTITVLNFVPVSNITGVPTSLVSGSALTATVEPSDASRKSIVWSIKDAGTTGASITANVILNAVSGGDVVVTATIANGLAIGTHYTQDFTITVGTTRIDELGIMNYELRVYPNPTSGELRIEISDMRHEISDISIFDVYGRKLYTSPLPPSKRGGVPSLKERAEGEVIIDISHLPNGIYFLRVDGRTVKVIKN